MDKDIVSKYKKAGKIAAQAREYGKKLCKEGALLLDIAEKVEARILELGGKLAFPCDVSVNEIAAHYSPIYHDHETLKQGDLVKIDVGAHIDGYIADTAATVSVGENEENTRLIKAAEETLAKAIELVKPGAILGEIGKEIENSITSHGFASVKNLTGHSLECYNVHGGIRVPNFASGDKTKLKAGQAIAIEPFPTTGAGWVVEGKGCEVYAIVGSGNIRQGKEILKYIKDYYKTLPFSKRDLAKKFGILKTNLALRSLLSNKIIKEYSLLKEKRNGKVGQAEHTILVLDKPIIITK